jgi:hypothetical protein
LESTCAFILRMGSRTLSTWKSCACHLCITTGGVSLCSHVALLKLSGVAYLVLACCFSDSSWCPFSFWVP